VPRLGQVLLRQPADQFEELSLVGGILRRPPQTVGGHLAEELDRVAPDPLPGLRVQELEERTHLRPPGPTQVVGQGEEREELFGYPRYPEGFLEDGRQLDF